LLGDHYDGYYRPDDVEFGDGVGVEDCVGVTVEGMTI